MDCYKTCGGVNYEELGLDGLGKSCTYGSLATGSSDGVSSKNPEIDELSMTMRDLKFTTEETTNEFKLNDIRRAFAAAEHDATLTSGCRLQDGLCMSATFPCSKLHEVNITKKDEADHLDEQKEDVPHCSHSNSLPAPVKLISAMKGSREQHGIMQTTKPRVSWAADVVEPPVTSVSHTVRSHQHRPQLKKHKRGKGKSNHGSKHVKKQHSKRSNNATSNNSLHSRVGAPAQLLLDPRPLIDNNVVDDQVAAVDFVANVSAGHLLEFVVAGSDKCGSNFLPQALGRRMHLPYAEAT